MVANEIKEEVGWVLNLARLWILFGVIWGATGEYRAEK